MKKIIVAIVLMAVWGAAQAQNPLQPLKNGIDSAITNQVQVHSISAVTVGTQMKRIADSIAQYFAQLKNLPTALPPNGGAGGSLAGSYPNPALAANSVGVVQLNASGLGAGRFLGWDGLKLVWDTVIGGSGNAFAGYRMSVRGGNIIDLDSSYLTLNQFIDTDYVFQQKFNTGGLPGNFSLSATNSAMWTSGKLNFTGNPNTYADYIRYNDTTMLENVIETCTFIYDTMRPTTDLGLQMGLNSVNVGPSQHNLRMGYVFQSGANKGKIIIDNNSKDFAGSLVYSSASNTNMNAGDTMVYILNPTPWAATATIINKTQHWTISQTFNLASTGFYNGANCAINHLAGSYSVLDFNYRITHPHVTLGVVKGNSIAWGQCASSFTTRYGNKIMGQGNIIVGSGGADVANMVTGSIKELGLFKIPPKFVLLGDGGAGGNDILFGYGVQEALNTLARAYNNVLSIGSIPIIMLPSPRSATDMRPFIGAIKSTFPSVNIIDVYTPLHDTATDFGVYSYLSCDGTHLLDTAHTLITNTIDSFFLYKQIYSRAKIDEAPIVTVAIAHDLSKADLIGNNDFTGNNNFNATTFNQAVDNGWTFIPDGINYTFSLASPPIIYCGGHQVITLPALSTTGNEVTINALLGDSVVIVGCSVCTTPINKREAITLTYNTGTGDWSPKSAYSYKSIPNSNTKALPAVNVPLKTSGQVVTFSYVLNPSSPAISPTDYYVQVDGSGTITLPTTGIQVGQTYLFRHYGASNGSVTIAGIDPHNVALSAIDQSSVQVIWNGVTWKVALSNGVDVLARGNVVGKSNSNANVVNYTTTYTGLHTISAALRINTVASTTTLVTVTYTDEAGNVAQSVNMATAANGMSFGSVGNYPLIPVTVWALTGTTITVGTALSGSTMNYDLSAEIKK